MCTQSAATCANPHSHLHIHIFTFFSWLSRTNFSNRSILTKKSVWKLSLCFFVFMCSLSKSLEIKWRCMRCNEGRWWYPTLIEIPSGTAVKKCFSMCCFNSFAALCNTRTLDNWSNVMFFGHKQSWKRKERNVLDLALLKCPQWWSTRNTAYQKHRPWDQQQMHRRFGVTVVQNNEFWRLHEHLLLLPCGQSRS